MNTCIRNGHPREENRAAGVSDKSARIVVRVGLVDDPRAEVGEDVRVGVCVMECNQNCNQPTFINSDARIVFW